MQLQQGNDNDDKSSSVQTGESQRQKDESGGVPRERLLTVRSRLAGRVTVELPYRNTDDDYVPVVDVLSVMAEIGFESRVFVQSSFVNLIQESVYLEVLVSDPQLGKSICPLSTFVLYRQAVHSLYDDRVNYQCFYGLASIHAPTVPVYWIGVGLRLRNGKTRHFPADASLDGNLTAQWEAMLHQDPDAKQ